MHEDRNGQDRRNRIPVIGLTGGIRYRKIHCSRIFEKS